MFEGLGTALTQARKSVGFSVLQMSRLTGYSERSIYRYESGELIPSLEYIVFVSKLCSIPMDILLGLDN